MSGPSFDDARDLVFEKVGLGYRGDLVVKGVILTLDRITESRGELHGELTVTRSPEGHLLRSRFNVSGMNARSATAKFLTSRSNHADWAAVLEAFCLRVLEAERAGEPWATVGGKRPASGSVLYTLAPIIPANRSTIIFGDGGSGKSTICTAIAVSVSTGRMVLPDFTPSVSGPVLVLDWEADADEWHERVVAVSKGIAIEPPTIHYRACVGPLTGQVEQVAAMAQEVGAVLLIVDSVGMASPSAREGTDANEAALRLFGALREIGVTALLIDHISKAGADAEGGAHKPYGSIYKSNLARSTWELVRGPSTGPEQSIAMYHRKANRSALHQPIGLKVIHGTEGEIDFYPEDIDAMPSLAAKVSVPVRIVRALSRGAMSAPELAAELAVSDNVVRVHLSRLMARRQVTKLGDGRWALLESMREAA